MSDWTSLPDDLLSLILSKLCLIEDIDSFSAVCKAWQFVPRPHVDFSSQFLLTKIREESMLRFHHPFGHIYHLDGILELRGAFIWFAKDGWLLMSKGLREMFFYHPFTKSKVQLPSLKKEGCACSFTSITFTSDPTSDDCIIFGITIRNRVSFEMHLIRRGEKEWRKISPDDDGHDIIAMRASHTNLVYHKGKFYYVFKYGWMLIFDPTNDNDWVLITPDGDHKHTYDNYLLSFNGDLVSVNVASMGSKFSILRWDEPTTTWKPLDDLGEYTLFLSETCLARKAKSDFMKNKIYIPDFRGRYVVFYCLKERSYRTLGNGSSSNNLEETNMLFKGFWIEPAKEQRTQAPLDWLDGDNGIGIIIHPNNYGNSDSEEDDFIVLDLDTSEDDEEG